MKPIHIFRWLALLLVGCAFVSSPVHSTYVEKKFVVCRDRGQDVLCDPYTVKEKDYVLKVFREKGEIASTDLSWFLEMFQRLNPDVKDINLIYANQRVLVPLKIIEPGTLEGQETGVVTIPLITITNIPVKLQGKSTQYIVAEGDCISKLLARQFGNFQSRSYKEALEIFKFLNPDIKDPNKIHVGQKIKVPTPSIREESWYPELFNESGKLVVTEEAAVKAESLPAPAALEKIEPLEMPEPLEIAELPEISELPEILEPPPIPEPVKIAEDIKQPEPAVVEAEPATTISELKEEMAVAEPEKPAPLVAMQAPPASAPTIFKKAARVLDADLMDNGQYFFPRKGDTDLRLDLSVTPVLELRSGQKVLLVEEGVLSLPDQDIIQSYWNDLVIVKIPGNDELRSLLTFLCPIIHKNGCENSISFDDQGVSVSVQGEYIFNTNNGPGKTCLTLIDIEDQKTPNSFRLYLASNMIELSEWIDSGTYFGPSPRYELDDIPAQPVTTLTGGDAQEFVRQFAQTLGLRYQEKLEVTFDYAGFQVKALSNLLSAAPNQDLLVDFGDLQGDALQSLETTGFRVIQIDPRQDRPSIMKKIMDGLPINYEENPTFWTAERRRIYNSSVRVPGFLIDHASNPEELGTLVTFVPIAPHLLSFFDQSGLRVIRLIQ